MDEEFTKIKLDLTILSFSDLNINEFFTLLKLYANNIHKQYLDYRISNMDIKNLLDKKYIRGTEQGSFVLRDKAKKVIEKAVNIKFEKKNVLPPEKRVEILADDMRGRFSKLKSNVMGDRQGLIQKLLRWKEKNPKIKDGEILQAVDLYLDQQDNLKYLQRADYFVYKTNGGTTTSRLSMFVEQLKAPKENSDWTSEIK